MNDTVLKYKPDFERAAKYWDAFWAHEIIDRPPVIIWAKNDNEKGYINHRMDDEFEATFVKFENFFQSTSFLGECIPCFRPDFGPDQMAAFLGAPLVSGPEGTNTSWSQKIVEDWKASLPLEFNKDTDAWKKMAEYHKAAARRFEGKCLVSNIDMHSNIDMLEGLRGAEKLIFDIIDNQELILKALQDSRKVYAEVFNELWEYGNKSLVGTTSWISLYSRKKFNPIQADFIALLNPEMCKKFVLPEIEYEAQFLDHSCFHLDGPDALKHLDDILSIKEIDCIQWIPGAGNKPQIEWPDVLHRIHKAGKSTIIYAEPQDIKRIHKEYPPNLVVYETNVKTEQEGWELIDWLVNNC